MLWRLLMSALYGARLQGDYNMGEGGDGPDELPPALDPVDKELVGAARVDALWEFADLLSLTALSAILATIIKPDTVTIFENVKTNVGRGPQVHERYSQHFVDLEASTLIEEEVRGYAIFLSGYFSVLKGLNNSRAIFNGKRLSKQCTTPPPVHLPSAGELAEKIRDHCRTHGRCETILGDFRHWFHQIPMPRRLRRYFCLQLKKKRYCWRGLPMGWSHSPAIAQAAGWAFLMYRRTGEKALFDEDAFRSLHMPTFVPTASGKGFVSLYYDNFIIMTADANEANAIRKRILANSEALHIMLKPGSFSQLSTEDVCTQGFTHLGIRWLGRKERPQDKRMSGVSWWVEKRETWKTNFEATLRALTSGTPVARDRAAAIVGQAIFCVSISGKKLCHSPCGRIIRMVARQIGSDVHQDADGSLRARWKRTWNTDQATSKRLVDAWNELQGTDNTEIFGRAPPPKTEMTSLVLATDASDKGYGAVLMRREKDGSMTILATRGGRWHGALADWHIYLKEARALFDGLRWAKLLHPGERFDVIVDNSALAFALQNEVSSNQVMMSWLEEYEMDLQLVSRVTLAASADNPADVPSRPDDPEIEDEMRERIRNATQALRARDRGWNWASKINDYKRSTPEDDDDFEYRHGEPDFGVTDHIDAVLVS